MARSKDEALYIACMDFCKIFTHYLCEENRMNNMRDYDPAYEEEILLTRKFNGKKVRHSYNRLKEAIEELEKEGGL